MTRTTCPSRGKPCFSTGGHVPRHSGQYHRGSFATENRGLHLDSSRVGFVVILLPMACFGPHSDPVDVFTSFRNAGEWPTQGVSLLVGIIGPAWSLMGPDGPVHMSEEIANPAKNVPRAIIYGLLLNGLLGFGMLLGCLFTMSDTDTVFASPTGFPFMAIFQQAVVNPAGAAVMASIVTTLTICATISYVATSSRMTWSFARDRGLPSWQYLSRVRHDLRRTFEE